MNEVDEYIIRQTNRITGTTETERTEAFRKYARDHATTIPKPEVAELVARARSGDWTAVDRLCLSFLSVVVEFALKHRPVIISRTWAIDACRTELQRRILDPSLSEPFENLEKSLERAMDNYRGLTLSMKDLPDDVLRSYEHGTLERPNVNKTW